MKVELGDGRTVHVKIMHDNYTGFNKGGAPGAAAEAGRVRGKTVAEVTVIGADQSKTTFTGVSFCAPATTSAGPRASSARWPAPSRRVPSSPRGTAGPSGGS